MAAPLHQVEEATEIYGWPQQAALILTCEHASLRVPPPLEASPSDAGWLSTHWGWDIGVAEVSRALVRSTRSLAVLARFSRLVCDPNRDPADETYIRTHIDGCPLSFNQGLEASEIERRTRCYHTPFHQAVHDTLAARVGQPGPPPLLLSMHSFTPVWAGQARAVQIGVLYDHSEPQALQLAERLRRTGLRVMLNEPYSARDGLAYSVTRHGLAWKLPHIELELNQALLITPTRIARMAQLLHTALEPWLSPEP